MKDSRMRKPRFAALAVALAACGVCGAARAEDAKPVDAKPVDAKPVDPNSLEAKLQKLVDGFYGTLDVSVDDTTKGMNGFVAYHINAAGTGLDYSNPKNGGAGPVGNVGWMPAISSNKSGLGWRGDHPIADTDMKVVVQLEASIGMANAPGLKTSYTAQSNSTGGTIGSGDTYLGIASKSWGAVKAGVTYAPYKKSTDRMNPFSGMLGDYAVVMGNTGGDNRVEFGTRLEHSIWYESPIYNGMSLDILFSPGQNRTDNNVIQSAGSSDCSGGNVPGSGNLPLNCDDGGFGNAFSAAFKYQTKNFYATAAFELHEGVNRNSDGIGSGNPIYGGQFAAATNANPGLLDPNYLTTIPGGAGNSPPTGCGGLGNFICGPQGAQFAYDGGTAPYLNDIANEKSYKVGVQYIFDFGLTLSGIFERMERTLDSSLSYQNERTRNGFWIAATQQIDPANNVNFGWAHAGTTPGDPGGQHNYDPAKTSSKADMFTLAVKHKMDKQLYFYADIAETVNHGNAHYDLGAGGRSVTTDCHDGTNYTSVDYSSNGPTTWGGCHVRGVSVGMNYKF